MFSRVFAIARPQALIAALACLAVADAFAQEKAPQRPPLPAGFTAEYDVLYVPGGDPAQALDVYFPATAPAKPLPLLIWIHGGGWSAGSKAQNPYLPLLKRGYVTASIEYRFSQKAKFPAQIQDCQAAIRWLRANSAKYHIDPTRVGVGGASAGGHLAALVGTSGGQNSFPKIGGNENQSDRVQAVCDIFGPTNFWTVIKQAEADKEVKNIFQWNKGDPYSKLIDARLGEDQKACEAVSPVTYVTKESPPFVILHGDRDTLVPYAQSEELAQLLQKAGVPVTLQRIPGAGHGGPGFTLPATLNLVTDFFDKHLQGREVEIRPLPAETFAAPTK